MYNELDDIKLFVFFADGWSIKPNNICSKQKVKCGSIQKEIKLQISSHNLVEEGQEQNKWKTSSGCPSQKEQFTSIFFLKRKKKLLMGKICELS